MKQTVLALSLLLFLSPISVAGPSQLQSEEIPQALFGCVKKVNGQVRVVDSLDECLPSETPVTFTVEQAGRRCPLGESVTGFTADGKMICSDGTVGTIEIGKDCPDNLVPGADVRNCDFSNRALINVDLSDADARGAIFLNANLNGAVFTRANMVGAKFAGATVSGASFDYALLEGTTIGTASSPAPAYSASFVGADLSNSYLYIYGDDIDFTQAELTDSSVRLGSSSHVNQYNSFQEARVENLVVYSGSRCHYCNFDGVTGDSTRWYGDMWQGSFEGAVLTNAYISSSARFSHSSLDGANLSGSRIYGEFQYATLVGADLSHLWWYLWPYPYSELFGAVLTDANLVGTYVYYWSYIEPGSYLAPEWNNTTCPDGSNSDDYPDGSCYHGRIN